MRVFEKPTAALAAAIAPAIAPAIVPAKFALAAGLLVE